MTRELKEWRGANDDSAIPPRVKDRIFKRCGERCQECRRPLNGRDKPEFDHIKALINSGEHRETNLQALCSPCHGTKTKVDVGEKSKVYQRRVNNLGFAAPKHKWQSRGFPKRRPQNSTRPPERRTYHQ